MLVKKIKTKHIEAIADDTAHFIEVAENKVKISKKAGPDTRCLWFGLVSGEKYFICIDENIYTNLADEQQKIKVILNPAGKVIAQIGEENHVVRDNNDIESDEKILVFYALRTRAEYFVVNSEFGKVVINRFVDQRHWEQTVALQKLLLRQFLPDLMLNQLKGNEQEEQEGGECNA